LGLDIGSSIFLKFPEVAQYVIIDLLKLVSGTGDFARVHAHHFLRARLAADCKFDIDFPVELRNVCLVCMCKGPSVPLNLDWPLDSEWHMLFECCSTSEARFAFRNVTQERFSSLALPWASSVESLVVHILRAREFPDLFLSFLKFVTASMSSQYKAKLRLSDAKIRSKILQSVRPGLLV
jgi:hypothetical protein